MSNPIPAPPMSPQVTAVELRIVVTAPTVEEAQARAAAAVTPSRLPRVTPVVHFPDPPPGRPVLPRLPSR